MIGRRASEDASLTIVEYSDFQCPYCALLAQDLKALHEKYPDEVQIIFRHFPLPSHPLSKLGAQAAEAAGRQGKFWEMHDVIFASQQTTNPMTPEQFTEWLGLQAEDLGLDVDAFNQDLNDQEIIDKVDQAQKSGIDNQIPGTPFVLVNGDIYSGPRDVGSFEGMLKLFDMEESQYTSCPPMVIDPNKQYTATLKTEKGDVVIQLFADKAPQAVNSFVFLAREGWYDNTTFYFVVPDTIAQTGDPSATGLGSPGYWYQKEDNELNLDKPGVVGMVDASPTMNGSQFFIALRALPEVKQKYTVFGEVLEGMDVLKQLTPRNPSQQMGLPPGDMIYSIEITKNDPTNHPSKRTAAQLSYLRPAHRQHPGGAGWSSVRRAVIDRRSVHAGRKHLGCSNSHRGLFHLLDNASW